jgi:hypothetical protein
MIGGFVAFILTVLMWPFIASSATTPRWGFIAIVGAIALFRIRIRMTTSHVLFMLMLGYGAVSLFWTEVPVEWWANFLKLLFTFFAFMVAAELKSIRGLLIGAACGLTINSVIVYMQIYGWTGLPQVSMPGGLFMNKDMGAELAALVLIGLVYERLWWFVPLVALNICQYLLPTEIIPIGNAVWSSVNWAALLATPINLAGTFLYSRGALVSVIAVLGLMMIGRYPRLLVGVGAVTAPIVGIYYMIHFDGSVVERISIWHDTVDGFTWFGRGLGSYYVTFPDIGHRIDTLYARPEHAHNDLLEFIYEMGIGAIIPVAFAVSVWRSTMATEKAIFLGFMVQTMFGFPLHMPATAACFAVVAGRCAGGGPVLRDDINACRTAIRMGLANVRQLCRRDASTGNGKPAVPARVSDQEWTGVSLRRNGADTGNAEYGDRTSAGSVAG